MPQFNHLSVSDSIVAEMIEHARTEAPNECCGLLAGHIAEGVGTATRRFAIRNDEASPREYLSNPKDMLLAFHSMREHGLEMLAIYHSHPASEPVPSLRDIERNTYGECVVHLIVSQVGSEPKVRAWWLTATGYREAAWHAS